MESHNRTHRPPPRRHGLRAALLVAAALSLSFGHPAQAQEAGQDRTGNRGVHAAGGVKASPGRPIRQIVTDAIPAVGSTRVQAPVRSKAAPKVGGLNRPIAGVAPSSRYRLTQAKMLMKHAKLSGWPRIPDLPQVKAQIAKTNGVKSRFDVEKQAQTNPAPDTSRVPAARTARPSSGSRPAGADGNPARARMRDLDPNPAPKPDRARLRPPTAEEARRLVREQDGESGRFGNIITTSGPTECAPPAVDGIAPVYVEPEPDLTATPAAPELAPPPTPLQIADEWLAEGDPTQASAAYLEHLETAPEDSKAIRSLALAVLLAGRPEQASELFQRAYTANPSLASQPIDPAALPRDRTTLRELVRTAIAHANRFPSAEAWLMAAALVQGEGRRDVARTLLDRAAQKGLDPEVVSELRRAIAP